MDLSAFIHVVDPTKVKIAVRERAEGETKLMDSTIGRVVPLLPVSLARAESKLEASVDKLFDEVVARNRGFMLLVNMIAERPKHPHKKRPAVMDASDSSHPLKKLRRDYGTSSKAATGGKSLSVLKELSSRILNVEVGVAAVATLPLVTSLAVVTSHAVNDPYVLVSETGTKITSPVHASMFHDSDSTEIVKSDVAGPSYSAKQDLSMGSRELNVETLHQAFVLQWNVLNNSLLDDSD
nr:hypothetical protein [Tanacetum cinerariifolium]